MEPDGLDQVYQHFTIFNHVRLLSSDPLFLSENDGFTVQTAHTALSDMWQKYSEETKNTFLRWDQALADWFAIQFRRFDTLIHHYQKQMLAQERKSGMEGSVC